MDFIDQHRAVYGAEPIGKALQVAPSNYWRHAAQCRYPELRSARAKRDDTLRTHFHRLWQANFQVYGAEKAWRQLRPEQIEVTCCTVERLMRREGLRGVIRVKVVRTTVGDATAPGPSNRMNRQFCADRPNQLWVSDFTFGHDLAGLRLYGPRDRRRCTAYRRLAREQGQLRQCLGRDHQRLV